MLPMPAFAPEHRAPEIKPQWPPAQEHSAPEPRAPITTCSRALCPSDHQPNNILPQYFGPKWPPTPERFAQDILPQWPSVQVPIKYLSTNQKN